MTHTPSIKLTITGSDTCCNSKHLGICEKNRANSIVRRRTNPTAENQSSIATLLMRTIRVYRRRATVVAATIGKMMITGQISWALESCKPGMGAVAGGDAITSKSTLNVMCTK